MSGIVGILLAAGASRRFGADKRWHRLPDGTPMALASARHLLAACPNSVAVIRPEDLVLAEQLRAMGLGVVTCTEATHGMGHSLAAGVAATADATGWLIALADMPAIQPASIRCVAQALEAGAPLARAVHAGRPGHPVGFAQRFRSDLLALSCDEGARHIVQAHRETLRLCPVDDPGVLLDIDIPGAVGS